MKYSKILYCGLLISVSLYGTDNPEMGVSDLNVSHYGGRPSTPGLACPVGIALSGDSLGDVPYDDMTGARPDINVTILPTDLKPTVVRIRYVSPPWLNYEDDEHYDVRFIPKPTEWTGHGKTGHVVDDDISTYKSRRLEW